MRILVIFSIFCSTLLADTKVLSDTSMQFEPIFSSDKILDRFTKTQNEQSYENYKELIVRYAKQNNLNAMLLAAIIKVESNFDKKAVSATNAIGLMQIKLDQSVSDVYKNIFGRIDLPPIEQLLDPQFNISIGSAYLNLISTKYFKDIKNPQTKEYCIIAAYNAGAGEVLRTFSSNKIEAQTIINNQMPDEVLANLKTKLMNEQGRRYIQKVLDAKNELETKNSTRSPNRDSFIFVNPLNR